MEYYSEWTPMVMLSDNGDEVIHKDKFFVCVYHDDYFGPWTYMVQLPVSARTVYPGTKENPLSFDSKEAAKQSVDEWDDTSYSVLRAMEAKGRQS